MRNLITSVELGVLEVFYFDFVPNLVKKLSKRIKRLRGKTLTTTTTESIGIRQTVST